MKRYTVLWFDDEHDKLESIFDEAHGLGIDLIGHKDAETGLAELSSVRNRIKYDAVLLDGKFHKTPEELGSTALGNSAFVKVVSYLRELKSQGVIVPWFVLSGQPNFVLDQDDWIDEMLDGDFGEGRVFDKNVDEDVELLCKAIRAATANIVATQVKHKYAKVFELCQETYLGESAFDSILELATDLETEVQSFDTKDKFTAVRKAIEKLFHAFNRLGFIPDEITQNAGWLNKSSGFLSERTEGYEYHKPLVHPLVSHQLWNMLQIVQDASHSEGELRLKVDDFVLNNGTSFLYKGIVLQLFDVLVWFKGFSDSNPNVVENKLIWEKKASATIAVGDWILGTLTVVQSNRWGTFVPDGSTETIGIPDKMMATNGLSEGMRIHVTTKPGPGGKTFIDKIKI